MNSFSLLTYKWSCIGLCPFNHEGFPCSFFVLSSNEVLSHINSIVDMKFKIHTIYNSLSTGQELM